MDEIIFTEKNRTEGGQTSCEVYNLAPFTDYSCDVVLKYYNETNDVNSGTNQRKTKEGSK